MEPFILNIEKQSNEILNQVRSRIYRSIQRRDDIFNSCKPMKSGLWQFKTQSRFNWMYVIHAAFFISY